jgi:hypothetical protein
VLDDREILREYGERCRQRAERYRWPQVATELERVYSSLVDSREESLYNLPQAIDEEALTPAAHGEAPASLTSERAQLVHK